MYDVAEEGPWRDVADTDNDGDVDVDVDVVEERLVGEAEAGACPAGSSAASMGRRLYEAFERMFRDAEDSSHYTGDYMTKWSERVGAVLPEIASGVASLRAVEGIDRANSDANGVEDSYALKKEARRGSVLSTDELVDRGRQTLIRIETSANRATLKKLSEMMFQVLFDHECYKTHSTWTLFCKYPMMLAFRSQESRRRALLGLPNSDLDDAGLFQPLFNGGGSGDEECDAQPDETAMLRATLSPVPAEAPVLPVRTYLKKFGMVEDHGEGVDDAPAAEDPTRITLASTVRQFDNYIHRGCRQPLGCMGLYHYAMYVYQHWDKAPQIDFATYLYGVEHPKANCEVQKLRLDEAFRVPRLFGATLPAKSKDPETNALIKTILFRSISFPDGASDCESEEVLREMFTCFLDDKASYLSSWDSWFAEQVVLATRFNAMQDSAGKLFSLDDIDIPSIFIGPRGAQPTAAEFMASITVEVVTNMDMGAEAKRRGPRATRPDPADYEKDLVGGEDTRSSGMVPENGPPAGMGGESADVDDRIPAEAIAKITEARVSIPQEEVPCVAFFEEQVVSARMKKFADAFAANMGAVLRPLSTLAGSLYTFDSAAFSFDVFAAAAKAQKTLFSFKKSASVEPEAGESPAPLRCGLGSSSPAAAEFMATGHDLLVRDYAARLLKELEARVDKPVVLGVEQRSFLAMVVEQLEDMVVAKQTGSTSKQRVFLLLGQGGSGKSELINIVRALVAHYLGGGAYIAMASSNTAARGVNGDTIHSTMHWHGEGGMTLDRLGRGVSAEFKDKLGEVACMVIDEISLVTPRLFGAASFRFCLARSKSHAVQAALYTEAGHAFGGIPLVILAGDFYQLCPFDNQRRVSLIMPGKDGTPEHRNGVRCFEEIVTDVTILTETFRFRDAVTGEPCPYLDGKRDSDGTVIRPGLFSYMRNPRGEPLPRDLWHALQSCQARGKDDPRVSEPRRQAGYEMAMYWETVGRLMQYRASRESRTARQMLVYIQAIDIPVKDILGRDELRKALGRKSMTETANRLAFLPLFIGMRVRLTAKLSAKHKLVNDATGYPPLEAAFSLRYCLIGVG